MVQVGDQRSERIVGSSADSGLRGRAGVIRGHGSGGDPDPLQLVVLEGEAIGAPTHAEPAQAGTLQRQEAVRLQREELVHVADHVLPAGGEVGAGPALIAQHGDRVFAEKIGVLIGVGAADFGKRLGGIELLRLVVGIADFDERDFAAGRPPLPWRRGIRWDRNQRSGDRTRAARTCYRPLAPAAGKDSHQGAPDHVCHGQHAERTQRNHRKEEAPRDGFELSGILRRGFAPRNPQDRGFRFRDGVGQRQPSV